MKSLKDYILESNVEEVVESQEGGIVIDFKDLEKNEETLKSLKDANIPNLEVDEEGLKATLNVKKDGHDADDYATLVDILQQYCNTIRHSQKATNDEQYAQKTVKFAKTLNKVTDAIDSLNEEVEEEPKDEKNDDKENE